MDYVVLIGLIALLLVCFWIDRKKIKDFFHKGPYQQFNAVRLYFILIVAIILIVLKIFKS
jgi:small-conductance mechanosensitive channel